MTGPHGVYRIAPVADMADWDAGRTLTVAPLAAVPTRGRRALTLLAIARYIAEHGYPPSYSDVAQGVGYRSKNTVAYQVGQLRASGLLGAADEARRPRALRLVQPGEVA